MSSNWGSNSGFTKQQKHRLCTAENRCQLLAFQRRSPAHPASIIFFIGQRVCSQRHHTNTEALRVLELDTFQPGKELEVGKRARGRERSVRSGKEREVGKRVWGRVAGADLLLGITTLTIHAMDRRTTVTPITSWNGPIIMRADRESVSG